MEAAPTSGVVRVGPLGWTLAALLALAVQTLLGEVSEALCLLAPANALLQVELLLHGGLGVEALALDVAHQSSALSLGREAPEGALEGLVVGEFNAEIDGHACCRLLKFGGQRFDSATYHCALSS